MRHEPKVSSTLQIEVLYPSPEMLVPTYKKRCCEELLLKNVMSPSVRFYPANGGQHFLQRNHKQLPEYTVPLTTNNNM